MENREPTKDPNLTEQENQTVEPERDKVEDEKINFSDIENKAEKLMEEVEDFENNGNYRQAAIVYTVLGNREKANEMFDKVEESKKAEAEPVESQEEPDTAEEEVIENDQENNQDQENLETELSLEGLAMKFGAERDFLIDKARECKDIIQGDLEGKKLKKFKKEVERVKEKGETFNNNYNIRAEDREALISEDENKRRGAEKRRENYIKFFTKEGVGREQAEAIYEEELQKEVYRKSKVEYGREKLKQRVEELVEDGTTEEEAKKTAKAEIFDELIVKESEIIKKAEIEQLPPKERKWYKKTLDWYLRQNTVTRLLISTGIITGAVAYGGGFGASSLAMFAGYRFLRGAGSVFVGKLASAGVGWAMKSKIEKGRAERDEEMKKTINLDDIDGIEKKYKEHLLENKKEDRAVLLTKAFAGIAAGMGTAMGIGMIESAYSGGGGAPNAESSEPEAEKGGMIADKEEAPEAVEKAEGEKTLTYTDKQEFSSKFVKEFGEVGDYGVSEAQIAQSLLEGKITPEQYYDFLQEVSDGKFPVPKEEFLGKLGRQIEMYNEALKTEGVGSEVSQRAALSLLYKNIEESVLLSSQGEVSVAEVATAAAETETEPTILQIGSRGPQGSVIDSFRENPDLAREFGAPDNLFNENGEIVDRSSFDNWAGRKAHLLWLESAKEALKNNEVLGKLEELGYSKDMEGYGQMMRRIGEGSVLLDPEKQTMLIGEETDFLKARPTVEAQPESETTSGGEATPQVEQSGVNAEEVKKAFYEKFSQKFEQGNPVEAITRGEVSPEQYYNFLEEQYPGELPDKQESIKEMEGILSMRMEATSSMSGEELSNFLERSDNLIEDRVNTHIDLLGEKESLVDILTDSSVLEMERDIIESTGFAKEELALMKKVDVGYLMNELPEELVHKATLIQRQEMEGSIAELMDGKRLPAPPEGADEEYAMKQIELARILHELNPDQQEKHMNIGDFINDKNDFWKHLKTNRIV
jgi:hypothetical protein